MSLFVCADEICQLFIKSASFRSYFYSFIFLLGQPTKNGAKLRRELKMSVENDNIKFMREKERSSNASVKNISNSWQFKDDRNDPDQDRSRGCGGGGFNTPGRFVC